MPSSYGTSLSLYSGLLIQSLDRYRSTLSYRDFGILNRFSLNGCRIEGFRLYPDMNEAESIPSDHVPLQCDRRRCRRLRSSGNRRQQGIHAISDWRHSMPAKKLLEVRVMDTEINEPKSGPRVSRHRTSVALRLHYTLGMSVEDNNNPFQIPSHPCRCGLEALRHSLPLNISLKLKTKD